MKEREREKESERTFESKLKVFVITTFFVSKTEGEIIKVFTLPISPFMSGCYNILHLRTEINIS